MIATRPVHHVLGYHVMEYLTARTGHIGNLSAYHVINPLRRIGGMLDPKEGVGVRKTAFLVLDYRDMSDIFTKNVVRLQIADQIIVLHLKDASHQVGAVAR